VGAAVVGDFEVGIIKVGDLVGAAVVSTQTQINLFGATTSHPVVPSVFHDDEVSEEPPKRIIPVIPIPELSE
jgi:hypothetical protein